MGPDLAFRAHACDYAVRIIESHLPHGKPIPGDDCDPF